MAAQLLPAAMAQEEQEELVKPDSVHIVQQVRVLAAMVKVSVLCTSELLYFCISVRVHFFAVSLAEIPIQMQPGQHTAILGCSEKMVY